MRKLPVFVLAAATALTVAGVPMTAQAATCPTSGNGFYLTSCSGQSGNINSLLNLLGCSNGTGTKGATTGSGNCSQSNCLTGNCITGSNCNSGSGCLTGSSCLKGSCTTDSSCSNGSCSNSKSSSTCPTSKTSARYWR